MALIALHNEDELLLRISQDDTKAFAELFYAYHGKLGAFVFSLVQDKTMTQDIVQDVFTSLWVNRGSIRSIANFTSYLFIQTRNHALNCIRKITNERTRQLQFAEAYDTYLSEPMIFPDSKTERISLLERATEQLPPQQRRVFTMKKDGYRNPEIADALGISIESVKKYQQLALKNVTDFVRAHAEVGLMLACYAVS